MLQENPALTLTNAVDFSAPTLSLRSMEVHREAIARAKKYLAAEASLLEIILEVDRLKVYRELGLEFLTPYCEKYLGLSGEVAAAFVRVARKSVEVPELRKAVENGLSISKAKAIVSILIPTNQEAWIERARLLPRAKLEAEVVRENPKPPKPEKAKPAGENRTRLEFEVCDQDLAKQLRAQDLLSQQLGRAVSFAELQSVLLSEYLKKHDPVQKAERAGQKEASVRKPPALYRPRGHSLAAALKHAVNRRDRGACQAILPGGGKCGKTRWVHLHHIQPRSFGGDDSLDNMITLCSFHHRLWHEREEPG